MATLVGHGPCEGIAFKMVVWMLVVVHVFLFYFECNVILISEFKIEESLSWYNQFNLGRSWV